MFVVEGVLSVLCPCMCLSYKEFVCHVLYLSGLHNIIGMQRNYVRSHMLSGFRHMNKYLKGPYMLRLVGILAAH